ncbi:MAG: hypothetical protein QW275_00865 [Candidatus Anstonellaceae archaeon]
MDKESLIVSAAACAFAVILANSTGALANSSPLFSISLFAASLSSHFALGQLAKSGVSGINAAAALVSAVAFGWLAASVFSSSFSYILSLAAIPICFCAPAAGLVAKEILKG